MSDPNTNIAVKKKIGGAKKPGGFVTTLYIERYPKAAFG
jgi:hypothetical protein